MELELLNSILSLGPGRQGEDSQFNASLNIFFLLEMKISNFISHIPVLKSNHPVFHLPRVLKGFSHERKSSRNLDPDGVGKNDPQK